MIHLAALVAQANPASCPVGAAVKSSSSILDPIAKPIADVLAFFYSIVPNYAVAILVLSLVWMVLISPLTLKTTRSMLAMQKLAPEMKRLQEKHRNDRQALSAAQMELYKTHNVSPFGSCLPSILPLPVFIALFRVIDGLSHTSKINGVSCATPKYLGHNTAMYAAIVKAGGHLNAFGLDLAKTALSHHTSVATALPFYILLLIMMGTQYFQTAQMMSRNPNAQQNSQMAIMKYVPLIFGVVCIRFPAGVVLYYAMSNLCRIAQQYLMYSFDPKVKALAIQDVIDIEASAGVADDEAPSGLFGGRKKLNPSPAATKTRFSDLLGQSRQAADERRALNKGGTPSKAGGNANSARPVNRNGTSKAGAPARPAKGAAAASTNRNGTTGKANGSTAKSPAPLSKAAPSKTASSKTSPSNGAPSKTAPTEEAAASKDPATATKAAPTKAAPAPTKDAAAPTKVPAVSGPVGQSPKDPSPTNGTPSSPAPVAPPDGGGASSSRTGAGSGRTGAGGSRTGAQPSRNKRRGR